jgi:methionine-gamma-lyase
MLDPFTAWLLLRSMETVEVRMTRQAQNAMEVARFLKGHPKVKTVHYLGLLETGPQYDLYKKYCLGPGAMISFEVRGGEAEAFRLLDSLSIVKLAVSLGSTESLAQHPASMTHAGVDDETKARFGITSAMIRLSVGIEKADDIIYDLDQALAAI